MAGYIFTVSKEQWKNVCKTELVQGFFSPFTPTIPVASGTKRRTSTKIVSAFFGDLITMKPGDNIYFLSNRRLYGVAQACLVGNDCKYDNYEGASSLLPVSNNPERTYLTTKNPRARWVVFFEPCPFMFNKGADMDDVLSFRPSAFKMLRAFEKVSFIKIDDEENRALKEYISLLNDDCYNTASTMKFDNSLHEKLAKTDLSKYAMDINKALSHEENRKYLNSEMFIEVAFLQQIIRKETDVVGDWDYLSQQVIASPFKPVKYIDKIDILGYRFSKQYKEKPELITKFLIVELKKDKINQSAVEQLMQYVDWVCQEYASGDYSRVEAYALGDDYSQRFYKSDFEFACQRSFIKTTHPVEPIEWKDVKMIKYEFKDDKLSFSIIDPSWLPEKKQK